MKRLNQTIHTNVPMPKLRVKSKKTNHKTVEETFTDNNTSEYSNIEDTRLFIFFFKY